MIPQHGRLVVFDLEYTAWEGSAARGWSGPGEHREVIQIGATALDAETLAETAALSVYVRPSRNPKLSAYITALTGITDERLAAEGVAFPAALAALVELTGDATMLCNGSDADVLRENCVLSRVPYPFGPERTINIRPLFRRLLGDIDLTSSRLPTQLGLPDADSPHTGLGDARAISSVLRALRSRGLL